MRADATDRVAVGAGQLRAIRPAGRPAANLRCASTARGCRGITASPGLSRQALSSLDANLPISYRILDPAERAREYAKAWFASLAAGEPVTQTATDADGNYSLSVPATGDFCIVCATKRLVGRMNETSLWVLPVSGTKIDLNGSNDTEI